jgi:hypothetical protein
MTPLSAFNKNNTQKVAGQEIVHRVVKRKAQTLETQPKTTKPKKQKLLATKTHSQPPGLSKRPLYDTQDLTLLRSTLVGPKWDSNNWSCAYDAVLFFIHTSLSLDGQTWMSNFNGANCHTNTLLNILYSAVPVTVTPHQLISYKRDQWRTYLSNLEPAAFERFGHVMISPECILNVLNGATHLQQYQQPISCPCSFGLVYCDRATWHHHAGVANLNKNARSASLETWLKIHENTPWELHTSYCPVRTKRTPSAPLNSLAFVTSPGVTPHVLPSLTVTFLETRYHLRAIIYHGSNHFAVRVMGQNELMWTYDGAVLNGNLYEPRHIASSEDISWLTMLGAEKHAYIYLFNYTC